MWWFASAGAGPRMAGGRFDLPPPNGSCYLATTRATAVLEALQDDFGGGLVPSSALGTRVVSSLVAPTGLPQAAHLTSRRALAAGVTVGVWADRNRALTRAWAGELHGAGRQAIHHGAQHDPTGRGRAVTLFDRLGSHRPWGDAWPEPVVEPLLTPATVDLLARHDITVTTSRWPDLGLRDDIEPRD